MNADVVVNVDAILVDVVIKCGIAVICVKKFPAKIAIIIHVYVALIVILINSNAMVVLVEKNV